MNFSRTEPVSSADAEQAVEVVTGLLADQDFAFGKLQPPRERVVEMAGELRSIYDAVTDLVVLGGEESMLSYTRRSRLSGSATRFVRRPR